MAIGPDAVGAMVLGDVELWAVTDPPARQRAYAAEMRVGDKTSLILLVDDNPGDIRLAVDVFEDAGLRSKVATAFDGLDAVRYLTKVMDAAAAWPDLILVDINMPRMNGFELLSYIRQHRALAGIPVVVLSSSARPGDRDQAKALGATDYLVKPGSVEDYLVLASSLVRYMA